MLNNELSRFNKTSANKTNQHTSAEPSTFEEIAEMLTLSEDIAQTLSMETLQKLWDCYIDMIEEVKQGLRNLHVNILIELHDLHYSSHEKSDYCNFATSFKNGSFIHKYSIPTNDWNKYFAVN